LQRLTSLALIPLSIYLVGTFFVYVVFGGYSGAIFWLHSPVYTTSLVLFLGVGFHHTASGLQVVIEDYVQAEFAKLLSIIAVKFICIAFAILGILATLKILFGA
jgi:succinate dehydrogenase / fumarate reductase membrane anchor subunit